VSWSDLEEMDLRQALFLLDRIQAKKKAKHEERIRHYITLAHIASAPHGKKGASELVKSLKSEMYAYRELDEGDIEPDADAVEKLSKLFG